MHDNTPTVHYTELPPAPPGERLAAEWETYRREVGRLLEEGQEGKWALAQGGAIVGVYGTYEEARALGFRRSLDEPFLIREVRAVDRGLRDGMWWRGLGKFWHIREQVRVLARRAAELKSRLSTPDATPRWVTLPPAPPGEELAREWETYQREAGRMLAEGHEGKWALIKGDKILDVYDSRAVALHVGAVCFRSEPFLVHQIHV